MNSKRFSFWIIETNLDGLSDRLYPFEQQVFYVEANSFQILSFLNCQTLPEFETS